MGVRVRVEDCGGGGWCCRVVGVANGSVLVVGRGVGSFLACGEAWDAWLWIACCWVWLMIEGGCGRHGSL